MPVAAGSDQVRLVELRGRGAVDGVVAAKAEPVGEIAGAADEGVVDSTISNST